MSVHPNEPVLITDAPVSYDDQLAARKKRYLIMMSLRIPFLFAAVASYHIPWLAISLIVLSIPLPWMAVLIANDGPPQNKRSKKVLPGTVPFDRAIENPYTVVDAIEDGRPQR